MSTHCLAPVSLWLAWLALGGAAAGCGLSPASPPVSGQLVEYHSNAPIAGAVVQVQRRGWGRSEATGQVVWDRAYTSTDTTDADGRFSIDLPGPALLVGWGAGSLTVEADRFQRLRGIRAAGGDTLHLQTVARREQGLPGGSAHVGRYPDGRAFGWSFVEARAAADPQSQDLRLDSLTTSPLRAVLSTPPEGGLLFVSAGEQGIHVESDDYLLRYLDEPPSGPFQPRLQLDHTPGTMFLRTRDDRYAKLAWDPRRATSARGALAGLEEPTDLVVSLRYVYRPLPGIGLPFQPTPAPVDPLYAAAAAELPEDDPRRPRPRIFRLEVRDERGQARERHRVRLEAGVPKTVDGCPRNGAASWRYEDLLLTHDDEGLPQVSLSLVGEQSVHHTLPRWVSRRVETPFEFQVPGDSAEWETLHLVLQEVDGAADTAAELDEPLCF